MSERGVERDPRYSGKPVEGSSANAFSPEERALKRRARLNREQTVDIPLLRLVGSILLMAGAAIHARVFGPVLVPMALIAVVLFGYAALSWAALRAFYDADSRFDLALFFLITDVFVWTWLIAVTGGPASWLYFILLIRPADQAPISGRRAFWFANLSVGLYSAMLWGFASRSHVPIAWAAEGSKLLFLYAGGLYLSLAARRVAATRRHNSEMLDGAHKMILLHSRTEEELRTATENADRLNQAKSDLLAVVSHEIRNPLNGIMGLAQVSLHGGLPPEQKRSMELIKSSAEWLLGILNQILDFSRIESRRFDLVASQFDLRDRLRDWMKTFGSNAQRKGLELHCWIAPDTPRSVVGDEGRLRQVLENLVGNAIKFTDQGEISFGVTVESRTSSDAVLRFTVADSGPGFPDAVALKLFEPYVQGVAGKQHGGTGLGLSIARSIVELMGGALTVRNRLEGGAELSFDLRIWLQRMAVPSPSPLSLPVPARAALLLRSVTGARIMSDYLKGWGIETTQLIPGDESAAISRCGLFILDTDLPASAGQAAAARLLKLGISPRRIIMQLTSAADFAGLARCAELSLDNVVTRPVMPGDLADAINKSASPPGRLEAPEPDRTAAAPLEPYEILVVDDEDVNRDVTISMAEFLGHDASGVASAADAIELLSQVEFDVILLDLHTDGLPVEEVVARLRAAAENRMIRIIALTGDESEEMQGRCLRSGVEGLLLKPVSEAKLAGFLASRADSHDDREPSRDGVEVDFLARLLEGTGGNELLARKLSKLFVAEAPAMMRSIREALDEGDLPKLSLACHKLKGSVSNFGHPRCLDVAAKMERLARAGDLAATKAEYHHLTGAVDELKLLLLPLMQDPDILSTRTQTRSV